MKFTFSEQKQSTPPELGQEKPAEGDGSREREAAADELERLKEDAPAYGWKFDEARGVFRPLRRTESSPEIDNQGSEGERNVF